MSGLPRLSMLAPFQVRSFRFQWPADLATSWAFEMENLALAWFILVETQSVPLLAAFASLQFIGTLVAPFFGVLGDRIGHRRLLCLMRAAYLLLAAVLAGLAFAGALTPMHAFVIAGLSGLIRPSDIGLRNVLISETMPPDRLLGAIGLSRITSDSARVIGALAGAWTVAALGMGGAYLMVVALYAVSLPLTFRTEERARPRATTPVAPLRDLRSAIGMVWDTPPQLAAMSFAFLLNLTAYPFILGLLPYVAKDIYGTDQAGLGILLATTAGGCLAASLLLSRWGGAVLPARCVVIFAIAWLSLTLLLGWTRDRGVGLVLLALIGLAQGLCIVPMSVLQLRNAPAALRGRITGLRTLAVYGLPIGLWIAGPLIERIGFTAAATLYTGFGLTCCALMLWRWHRHLWPAEAPANRRT